MARQAALVRLTEQSTNWERLAANREREAQGGGNPGSKRGVSWGPPRPLAGRSSERDLLGRGVRPSAPQVSNPVGDPGAQDRVLTISGMSVRLQRPRAHLLRDPVLGAIRFVPRKEN